MTTIIKPPSFLGYTDDLIGKPSIFLAGSIEQGKAVNWQKQFEEAFADEDVVIYNPRRDDWNSSWVQSIENDQFRKQVEWELSALSSAGTIAMYIDPITRSPITLIELGLYATSGKIIVCCPKGFYRKGNVDIVCEKYAIPQADNLEDLIWIVKERVGIDVQNGDKK